MTSFFISLSSFPYLYLSVPSMNRMAWCYSTVFFATSSFCCCAGLTSFSLFSMFAAPFSYSPILIPNCSHTFLLWPLGGPRNKCWSSSLSSSL